MTTPKLKDWVRFHGTFKADPNKRIREVGFQIEANDAVSTTTGIDRKPIYFSDIQFQAGKQLSGWTPNTQEMMKKLSWDNDESEYVPSNSSYMGDPPKVYKDVRKRWFNVVGRGHKTFILPNYMPEDWDVEILPTGIDLTLYPKEDFDLLRVSSSEGVWIPEEEQKYKLEGGIWQEMKAKYEMVTSDYYWGSEARKEQEIHNWKNIVVPLLDKHPLHKRYTREFWVDGTSAGSEIKINATDRTASINGKPIPIVGEHFVNINGTKMPIDRKKFMIAPKGTATIRIEFYKQVEVELTTYDNNDKKMKRPFKYLKDVGIGYYGTAGFEQWTYGLSRI